ncbi:MAG: nucleotide exchange factor GrpE [Roseiflexaceae bacterium]|nr:nucleotide exchange factor GrpE [Roseiflexaceae bacterium]
MTDNQNNIDITGGEGVASDPHEMTSNDVAAHVAHLEQELATYKDQLLRTAADFKNYKRRTEQDRGDLIRNSNAALLLKLLPILDDMDRAGGNLTPEVANSAWYGGYKLIPQKLRVLLESEGITPIEVEGQEFDPTKHEAVIYDDEGQGDRTVVVAELQKGYTIRDRVLRPAMVKVGKA